MNSTGRARLFWFIRLMVGLLLLVWLFTRTSVDELWDVMATGFSNWEWWCLGIFFTGMGLLMAAVRWHLLVAAQSVEIPLLRMIRIFFIGQCFNSFLPGACGGDVARAYYMFRESATRRTEAASTVLVDRGIGVLVIIAYCCGMAAFRLTWFMASKRTWVAAALMLFLMLSTMTALIIFFRRHYFEQRPWLARLEQRSRLGAIARRVYNAFYVYRHQPRVIILSVWLSLGNMIFLTLACGTLGRSLNMQVSWLDYFTLFPIITVLSAIPITPGALGIRESLFAELFAVAQVYAGQAISLSLLVYGAGFFWSLIGGLLFIGYSARYGMSWRDEWKNLKQQKTLSPESSETE